MYVSTYSRGNVSGGVSIRLQHDILTSNSRTKEVKRKLHLGENLMAVYESADSVFWDENDL